MSPLPLAQSTGQRLMVLLVPIQLFVIPLAVSRVKGTFESLMFHLVTLIE